MGREKIIPSATPLTKQYNKIKAKYPEAILLFRVGDFYETFGDDAIKTSKALGIVLTKKANGASYMDLAGFPHHAVDTYLPKLVQAGYKVAICDQLEDPKLTKKIVKRGVTELITPGVSYNENILNQKENNYLAALHFEKEKVGIAFLDISTGVFKVAEGDMDYIEILLNDLKPKEILLEKSYYKGFKEKFIEGSRIDFKVYLSKMDEWAFVYESAYNKLLKLFKLNSLKGFGVERMKLGITAAGSILFYLDNNQQTSSDFAPERGLSHICSLSRLDRDDFVWIDRFTLNNLEVLNPATPNGVSLLDIIDRCTSPMGARQMRQWISMPSKNLDEIAARHKVVANLIKAPSLNIIRDLIGTIGDIERVISRAAAAKISPKEVLGILRALELFPKIKKEVIIIQTDNSDVEVNYNSESDSKNFPLEFILELDDCKELKESIRHIINPNTSNQIGKGEVIASGVSKELDELRDIVKNGKKFLIKIQEREMLRTGITSLKVGYNNVFGYYLEVRNTHKDKVPSEWIRKQTLVSAERYITEELKDYEEKILGASDKILIIESALYRDLIKEVQGYIPKIQKDATIVARLDCLASFAYSAMEYNYCCPEMNDGYELKITQGRHPVIERFMPIGEQYIANDLELDNQKQQIIILTGPNMSGKSALLRQTALIVLMAQIGSFVPAQKAKIGYCDKIFTRVGASDNISRGESTFMVEMLETSTILHNLSSRSLVLLDEIGRGTSTFDGMSIAWAIVKYLHNNGQGAKTLFATHYHELNELENLFPRIVNYNIAVKEMKGKILFLRKLCKGGVAHSFGIHVARLAGMPADVVLTAEQKLKELEASENRNSNNVHNNNTLADHHEKYDGFQEGVQLSFFQLDDPTLSEIKRTLENLDLNTMSPMDAFDKLREIKKTIGLNHEKNN
ncbi:MAG: DNA mismatch repair protein MutS [Bacteroidales bacterium]